MSSKRQATSELNHENWDNEEPSSEDGVGPFKAAPKDVLQTRVMRTAKRRAHLTTGGNVKKSVFSGFGGFNKAQPQSFDFLSKLTNGNNTEENTSSKNDAVSTSMTFTSKPQTSLFGATNINSGMFGKPITMEPANQSPFGIPTTQNNNSQTALFGANNSSSGMFDKPVTTEPSTQSTFGISATQNSKPQTGLFGATNINSGVFDKPASAETATQHTFGIPTTQNSKPQTGLFSATNTGMFNKSLSTEPITQSTFGTPTTQNSKPQTGLFGATNISSGMFDRPVSAEPANQSPFGTSTTQNSKPHTSLFGSANINSGMFGKSVTSDSQAQPTFGTPTTQSTLFGGPITSTTSATKPSFTTSSPISPPNSNPFNIQTVPSTVAISQNFSFKTTNANSSVDTTKLFSSPTSTSQSTFNAKSTVTTPASVFGTVSTSSIPSIFKTPNTNSTSQPFKTSSLDSSKIISNSTNLFGSSAITSVEKDQGLKAEQSKNSLKTRTEDKTDTDKKKDKEAIYHYKLSILNKQVSEWISTNVEKTPVSILIPIFRDYERYLIDLQKEYFGSEKEDKSSSTTESESKITSNITASHNSPKINESTINPKLNSDNQVNKTDVVKVSETSTSVLGTFAPISQAKNFGIQPSTTVSSAFSAGNSFSFSSTTNTSSNATSSTFSFGSNTTASTKSAPFSFGNGKPFSFNANIQKPAETTNEGKGEEDDEPPKVEFTPLVEENSVYDKRCKLFFKIDGNFIDKGLATLYIKKVEKSDKHQLLIRANTNIGKVLVNLILSSSIPMQRMGKNNVMLICIPTPESEPPPIPFLIRVKTGEEADQLLETLNKYKS